MSRARVHGGTSKINELLSKHKMQLQDFHRQKEAILAS